MEIGVGSMRNIAAVVAAAGRSQRMGEPKQLLPWGESSVIATVVTNLLAAGVQPVLCVVGHRAAEVQAALAGTEATVVENSHYLHREMLSSYQAGLAYMQNSLSGMELARVAGILLALGDQPHVGSNLIRQIVQQAELAPDKIVIPSYAMRRGHPFYLPQQLWAELAALGEGETLRELLRRHAPDIVYVEVDSDAILRDMDTPEEYRALVQIVQQD
jgi:molybdenum cofactor cytidylyltransferase